MLGESLFQPAARHGQGGHHLVDRKRLAGALFNMRADPLRGGADLGIVDGHGVGRIAGHDRAGPHQDGSRRRLGVGKLPVHLLGRLEADLLPVVGHAGKRRQGDAAELRVEEEPPSRVAAGEIENAPKHPLHVRDRHRPKQDNRLLLFHGGDGRMRVECR
ncbi:MAG: hypothetical protein JW809_09420 [Pirellulales bacterium]|nr:hypothetical protein [Pirellulales bacterium]